MTEDAMSKALDAIHDEAIRLLAMKNIPNEIRDGLNRIISIARYKFDNGPEGKSGENTG